MMGMLMTQVALVGGEAIEMEHCLNPRDKLGIVPVHKTACGMHA